MIYYFSATGNSLAMARKIGEQTGDETLSITRVKDKELKDDVIGIVFPVYYGDVPVNVQDFVRTHTFPKDAYIYAVATCGSSWGNCFITLADLLARQGCRLHYCAVCPMIANSTICMKSHVPYKWENLNAEDLEAKDIADDVKSRRVDLSLARPPRLSRIFSALMGSGLFTPFFRWYFNIHIDPARCKKCGECVRLCPVQNITMGERSAVMGRNCISCLACLHGCPYQAIKVRNRVVLKEDQYRHPGITLRDLER